MKLNKAINSQTAQPQVETQLDSVFNWFGKILQKVFRQPREPHFLISALAVNFIIFLFSITVALLSHSVIDSAYLTDVAYNTVETFVIVFLTHVATAKINAFSSDCVLPALTKKEDLEDWKNFLIFFNGKILPWIFGIGYGVYFVFIVFLWKGVSLPVSSKIAFALPQDILTGISVYYLFLALILPFKIFGYSISLFYNDPKSSQFIFRFGDLLDSFLLTVSFIGAFIVSSDLILKRDVSIDFNQYMIVQVWAPIIMLFIIRYSLVGQLIRRSKHIRLKEIQDMIIEIESGGDISDKETMEKISRLWDYHNRIKSSNDTSLDLLSLLTFINSLVIPLIAFILSNLDSIVILWSKYAP